MPDLPSYVFRAREEAKHLVLSQLHKRGLDITRNPFSAQLSRILQTRGVTTALDIGGNIGQYATGLRDMGFAGPIISCEPQSSAFATLAAKAAKDPAWTALNVGVGAEPGTLEINLSANSFSSSFRPTSQLHLDIAPQSRTTGTETATITTVDALVAEHDVDIAHALLKVDTQGFEDQVLDGAADSLQSVQVVQLEMSLATIYEGQKLFADLMMRMTSAGFSLYALEPGYADPRTGQLLWCDGVFVR